MASTAKRHGTRNLVRWTGAAIGLSWSAARRPLLISTGLTVAVGAGPVVAAWATKVLLDQLARGAAASGAGVAGAVAVIALTGLLLKAVEAVQIPLHGGLQRAVRIEVQRRLFQAVNALPGLHTFEDPDALDRIRLAEQAGDNAPQEVIGTGLNLVQSAITAGGFVATLVVLCPPLIPLVAVAAVPIALLQLRLGRLRADTALDISVYQRRQLSYRLMGTDVRAAKEIRLFGLGPFLSGRLLADLRAAAKAEATVDRTAARLELASGMIAAVVTGVGTTVAAVLALHGRLTVGDVTVLLSALVALHTTFGGGTDEAARGYQSLLMFSHYLAVTDRAAAVAPAGAAVSPLRHGIEFDDVWFRYGDDLPWVLRSVSCTLPAGAAVGLVGLNGAGKSTMVKLLCRMYEPQRGCIRWDGVDLRTFDPAALYARVSAVFQDYMTYDFTAADNIGVGNVAHLGDVERLRTAARLADADDMIAALPHGYRTLLSRIFRTDEDGARTVSLSGGQWQRIALARAFLRDEVDLLILDEPSSGLDAEVEYDLHQRLAVLRGGRLSLLISHRLNTLRDADTIVVLSDGTITEHGSHDELMAAGGQYAKLFQLQSDGYH